MPYLTNLAEIAKSAGLTVVEQPNWRVRGHGSMVDVRYIVPHHTAGSKYGDAPSLSVVQNGRSDLAGPLAHFLLARSGTVYVIAAGQCWHTGPTLLAAQSNPHAIGIEAEGTGIDPWPEVQMIAFAKLCAALAKAFGLPASRVMGHKEICAPVGRKVDPNFSMPEFRALVQKYMSGNPDPAPVTPNQEEDEYMSIANGEPTTGTEWKTVHVPLNGHRYLRVATSYGDQAKIQVSMVDDTPAGSGSGVKTVVANGTADADRPGPWDLSKTDQRYDNYSHLVINYLCDGPITFWVNDRP